MDNDIDYARLALDELEAAPLAVDPAQKKKHLNLAAQDATLGERAARSGVEHLRVEAPDLAKVSDPVVAIRAEANEATGSSACKVR